MSYWLLKSEPAEYSYTDLEREERTVWSGVANNLALKNMRLMKCGDLAFFYHTGKQRSIVGITEIITEAYPDCQLNNPKRVVVDIRPLQRLQKSVTLAQIKADSSFEGFDLVKFSRLSVMPVSIYHWQKIMQISSE